MKDIRGITTDEATDIIETYESRTYVVTELCSNCEREVEIHGWDTERDGYQAFCPYCGEVLMLCDECRHSEQRQPCDFDADTGLCRHRRNVSQ